MKKIVLFLLVFSIFAAFADERAELLRKFAAEDKVMQAKLDRDFTTVELTSGAAEAYELANSQLRRALDYKLRHTPNVENRLKLLETYAELYAEIQKIFDASREGTGSFESFLRVSHAESLVSRQAAIFMADKETEKRWAHISQSEIVIDGQKLKLVDGRTHFYIKMYNREVRLDLNLYIGQTFAFDNRDFALFRTDMDGSVNDDFATLYIGEFRNGKAVKLYKFRNPYYDELINKNGIITVRKRDEVEKIDLRKIFPR